MTTSRKSVLAAALLALAATLLTPRAASAQDERPWAKGVSDADKKQAFELFKEANGLLKDSLFVQAVEKYRAALARWDHPAIHYNLAFALMNLDQPVEVYNHLEKSIAYGPAPLDTEKYEHAKSYKTLIEKQLARIEVVCNEPGAQVTMDGSPLFVGPGKHEGLVRAGPHTIIATKKGMITSEKSKSLPPGEVSKIELKLYTAETLTAYRRKWSAWKPWVAVGAGATVMLVGGVFHLQAANKFKEFDDGIIDCGGCVPSDELNTTRSSGETFRTLAIISYAVGGVALVTGAALVYINRERPYRINPVEREEGGVSVMPVIGPGEGGFVAIWKF